MATVSYTYSNGSQVGWTNIVYAWSSNDQYTTRTIPKNSANDASNWINFGTLPTVTPLGLITAVMFYIEGKAGKAGVIRPFVQPIYNGTAGTNAVINTYFGLTDAEIYKDVTAGLNAPSPWTWTDVQNLDIRIYGVNSDSANQLLSIDSARIEVTYNAAPSVKGVCGIVGL